MYCTQCGKELKDNVNFCEFCGYELKKVVPKEIQKQKEKTRKINPIAIGAVVLAVVFLGIVIVLEAKQDIIKNKAIEDALTCMDEKNYESAITAFQKGFEYGDNDVEHYLLLAKAYVEDGDLYNAQKILQTGYENTKSEDLLHVELWGPAQPFDILVTLLENVPNVRQKYIFNGIDIEVQYYAAGKVVYTNKYYYDENGRLAGCQVYDYCPYTYGAGEILSLCADNLEDCVKETATSIFLSFDFVYPQADVVEIWSWRDEYDSEIGELYAADKELFATFQYENNRCVSMTTESGRVTLSYDETGRVASMSDTFGYQWKVTYSEQGDYSISVNNKELVMRFNSDGLNTEYIIAEDDDDYRITTYYGKVAGICYQEELQYQFTYNENKQLSKIENLCDGTTVECVYSTYSENEKPSYINFIRSDEEILTRGFEFDKDGRLGNSK